MIKCLKIDLIGDVTITAGGTVVAEIWSQNMKIMGKISTISDISTSANTAKGGCWGLIYDVSNLIVLAFDSVSVHLVVLFLICWFIRDVNWVHWFISK